MHQSINLYRVHKISAKRILERLDIILMDKTFYARHRRVLHRLACFDPCRLESQADLSNTWDENDYWKRRKAHCWQVTKKSMEGWRNGYKTFEVLLCSSRRFSCLEYSSSKPSHASHRFGIITLYSYVSIYFII